MPDIIRIGGIELGQVLEQQGDAWVIRTRRGGISTFVQFWLAGLLSKEKVGDFDPAVFERELREALDTPDGWRRLRVEEGVHKLEMTLFRKMSSDQLAAYMQQARVRYQKLVGIDSLNEDIFWRLVAKGGDIVGLPTALKKVLAEEIEDIARAWYSSEYVTRRGTPNTLIYHAGKGIGRGLENLDDCPDLNIVEFLLTYVETAAQEGYDRRMNPPQSIGPKDLLQHKDKLRSLEKSIRPDHSLPHQREDEDYSQSRILRLKDKIGDRRLDEGYEAEIRFQQIMEQLTDQQYQTVIEGFIAIEEPRKDTRERQRQYRAKRKVLEGYRATATALKKLRGDLRKKGKK